LKREPTHPGEILREDVLSGTIAGRRRTKYAMSTRTGRKAAIDAYKKSTPHRGVYAVRCGSSGGVWVGSSPNLEAARNGLWFTLRTGSCRDGSLQLEWQTHGEAAFSFEVLEELDTGILAMEVADTLKRGKQAWAARQGARTLP
jgi:hypothetical protein